MLDETKEACQRKYSKREEKPHTEISNKLLRVVINKTSFFYSLLNGSKVGIGQNHIRGEFGNISTTAHSHTDISLLQCRGIINTVYTLVSNEYQSQKVSPYLQSRGIIRLKFTLEKSQ